MLAVHQRRLTSISIGRTVDFIPLDESLCPSIGRRFGVGRRKVAGDRYLPEEQQTGGNP